MFNQFIFCIDDDLKREFVSLGLKIFQESKDGTYFVLDNKAKGISFNKYDKSKFKITNKLLF